MAFWHNFLRIYKNILHFFFSCAIIAYAKPKADVAELADAPDLGSGSERSEGSSPFIRIKNSCLRLIAYYITVLSF